jgi:hypothetical protein
LVKIHKDEIKSLHEGRAHPQKNPNKRKEQSMGKMEEAIYLQPELMVALCVHLALIQKRTTCKVF